MSRKYTSIWWHLGQTLLHEVGHYFNVILLERAGANVCAPSNTDEVADTPQWLVLRRMACTWKCYGLRTWRKVINNDLYGLYI
jgi:hypothetical protein